MSTTTTTTSFSSPYESTTKEYPPSPTSCSLGYSSSTKSESYNPSSGYNSPSSSSSSVSNGSSLPSTPEPEIKSTIKTPSAANNKPPKKQYQCTQCLKNFSRPSALQTHSYTHTFEKPFQCRSPGCGRRFSVVSNLRRHFKVHQKPSVGNKLTSEDRLRHVRQLIINSNAILAKQQQGREENEQQRGAAFIDSPPSTPPFDNDPYQDDILSVATARNTYNSINSSASSYLVQQQQAQQQQTSSSAVNRYHHYLLLPKINPVNHDFNSNNNNNNYHNHHHNNATINTNNAFPPIMTAFNEIGRKNNDVFLCGPSTIHLPFAAQQQQQQQLNPIMDQHQFQHQPSTSSWLYD